MGTDDKWGYPPRLVVDNTSVSLGNTRLHRHQFKLEPAFAQHLDLVSTEIRNDAVPHADGLASAAERVCEGLMSTAEVIDDLFEFDSSGQGSLLLRDGDSVSVLPEAVKQVTRARKLGKSKLAYMATKRTKDPWAIERGRKMREAREQLGYSQEDLSTMIVHPGGKKITREAISQIEKGTIKEIDVALVRQFVLALGLPLFEISRTATDVRDEGADIKVSTVARSIAYNFDKYPLVLQNQIRHVIRAYEETMAMTERQPRRIPTGNQRRMSNEDQGNDGDLRSRRTNRGSSRG